MASQHNFTAFPCDTGTSKYYVDNSHFPFTKRDQLKPIFHGRFVLVVKEVTTDVKFLISVGFLLCFIWQPNKHIRKHGKLDLLKSLLGESDADWKILRLVFDAMLSIWKGVSRSPAEICFQCAISGIFFSNLCSGLEMCLLKFADINLRGVAKDLAEKIYIQMILIHERYSLKM